MTPKHIKIAGEIILLMSFIVQTLLFDYYDDKSKSLSDAFIAQSLIDKGAELRELKYFTAKFPSDSSVEADYRRQSIRSAAFKIASAKIVHYTQLDTPKQVKIDMSNALIQASQKVSSFDDYTGFISFLNSRDVSAQSISNQIERISDRKDAFRWTFLTLYIVGAVFLIVATIREKDKSAAA